MTTTWNETEKPQRMTRWTNPLTTPQTLRFTVPARIPMSARDPHTGELREWIIDHAERVIEIAPGGEVELPSVYDQAVHVVVACRHPECGQGRCRRPADADANAYCMGGLGPQLVREGQRYGLHSSLVPRAEAPRSQTIAPGDVGNAIGRSEADAEDPAMQRARARARAGSR